MHNESAFVTLTYDEDHLPEDGCVSRREVQLFMKRLRKLCYPKKIRYYFVGEYGDHTSRAHYHAILFGVNDPDLISEAWNKGHVMVGDVNEHSAGYVVSYVIKAMTADHDPRLKGRSPEFATMSRKPGIGATAMHAILDWLTTPEGCNYLQNSGDVPGQIRWQGKVFPIGRYLKSVIRREYGFESTGTPETKLKEMAAKILADADIYGVQGSIQRSENARTNSMYKSQSIAARSRTRKQL